MNIDQFNQMPGQWGPMADAPKMFDFSTVFKIFKRRSFLVFSFLIFCLLGGFAVSQLKVDRYTAGSSVLLEAPALNPFGREQIFQGTKFDNVTIESQIQVLRSTLLLAQVVEDLDLDTSEDFWTPGRSEFAVKMYRARDSVLDNLSLNSGSSSNDEILSDAERFQAAVKKLREDVSISRNGITSVLNIKAIANTPALAADIANAVSMAFITRRYEMRQSTAEDAAGWFETRMNELATQLSEAEAELSARSTSGTGNGEASQFDTDAAAMNNLRAAISDRLAAQTKFDQIQVAARSQLALELLPAHLADGRLGELIQKFSETTDPSERLALSSEALPLVEILLRDAGDELTSEKDAEDAARAAMQGTSGSTATGSDATTDLRLLESDVRIYRQMFETYTAIYLRTKEQQTFPNVDASILAPAVMSENGDGLSSKKILAIALLLGLLLGGAAAMITESRDPRLRTRAGLAASVGAPVIGLLPTFAQAKKEIRSAPNRLQSFAIEDFKGRLNVHGDGETNIFTLPDQNLPVEKMQSTMSMTLVAPLSSYSETVRRIRVAFDNYFAPQTENACATIGFLSDGGAQTRSTLAMNYAEMVAMGGQRTLMVDFDWLEAYLSRTITPNSSFGIPDLMFAGENLGPNVVFWLDERTGLYFLPNRSMDRRDTIDPSIFDTARLVKLIDAFKQSFDQIVVDFGSLSTTVDAAALAPVVDGYVCSAEWGLSDQVALAKTMGSCGVPPEKIVGAVMSGVSEKQLARYEAAS